MINKNTPKSAIYWRKRLFHLKMFALRNSAVHCTYRDISFLINNYQAPSYRSEWSAFIMTDYKAREVAVALSQNLISFHKGAALRRGRQKCSLFTKIMLWVISKYFLIHISNRNPTGNLTGYCIPYFTQWV
jgi:hypothetical protein